ncbi:hypothetical protein [Truepera radiovictrix]|nr:hypothetical protein [Truepera radiovictrix]WMT57403.1 hypothetical protein RCV51_00305 [Truepera radiovictrix]
MLAASVGNMTGAALRAAKVTRVVQSAHERMGAMIVALAEHYRLERP